MVIIKALKKNSQADTRTQKKQSTLPLIREPKVKQ